VNAREKKNETRDGEKRKSRGVDLDQGGPPQAEGGARSQPTKSHFEYKHNDKKQSNSQGPEKYIREGRWLIEKITVESSTLPGKFSSSNKKIDNVNYWGDKSRQDSEVEKNTAPSWSRIVSM